MLQVLLLAAGASQRFGDNKLLQLLGDGQTVLDYSYRVAATLHSEPLLIIPDEEHMRRHCDNAGYRYRVNPLASSGMASSIVCGVTASTKADGWAICLADMPCIRAQTMQQLRAAWDDTHILRPCYRQRPGHPVIFPGRYFPQLTRLAGDQGAHHIVTADAHTRCIEVDDPGIHFDIDTPADMQQALAQIDK